MARKPNTGSREQLTPAELAALKQQLGSLSANDLEIYYRATHNACRYEAGRLPCPRVIQELVTAWKLLRKWAKR